MSEQKCRSFFVNLSSSFARQTVYFTFVLLLFRSMCFAEVTKGTKFCFNTRKGKCERGWNDAACDACLILKMILSRFLDEKIVYPILTLVNYNYEMSKKGVIGFSYKILFRSQDN